MLGPDEQARVVRHASLYDHAADFYATFLGEPFLVDDVLCYFDGMVLQVCAYSLTRPDHEIGSTDLGAIVSRIENLSALRPQAVVVWGRLQAELELIRHGYERKHWTPYAPSDVDWHVKVGARLSGSSHLRRDAALARRRYSFDQGSTVKVQHLALVDAWARQHDVSLLHMAFARGAIEYARSNAPVILEVTRGQTLCGWSVFLPFDRTGIVIQTFADTRKYSGVGDALAVAMIDAALELGLPDISWGYASTPGLAAFKRKWGGSPTGPPYRQALFVASPGMALQLSDPLVLEHRLYARAGGNAPT